MTLESPHLLSTMMANYTLQINEALNLSTCFCPSKDSKPEIKQQEIPNKVIFYYTHVHNANFPVNCKI